MTEIVQGKAYKISLTRKSKKRRDINHFFFFDYHCLTSFNSEQLVRFEGLWTLKMF